MNCLTSEEQEQQTIAEWESQGYAFYGNVMLPSDPDREPLTYEVDPMIPMCGVCENFGIFCALWVNAAPDSETRSLNRCYDCGNVWWE